MTSTPDNAFDRPDRPGESPLPVDQGQPAVALNGAATGPTAGDADERFAILAQNIPGVIYLCRNDARYTMLYLNDAVEELTGYPKEDFLADRVSFVELYHPEDAAAVPPIVDEAVARHQQFELHYRLRHRDGQWRWIHEVGIGVYRDGELAYLEGVLCDITERKQTEQALRRRDAILEAVSFAAERFMTAADWEQDVRDTLARVGSAAGVSRVYVFENQTDAAGLVSASQRHEWVDAGIAPQLDNPNLQDCPYVSGGFERWQRTLQDGGVIQGLVAELPAAERQALAAQDIVSLAVVPIFVGRHWWGFIGFDQCDRARQWALPQIEALRSVARALGAAIERRRTEQALRELNDTLETRVSQRTAELTEANRRLQEEIVRRERAADALRDSERRYRLLAEHATDMISRHTPEGVYTYASPACRTLLGYEPEEMVGRSAYDFFHPDDLARIRQTHTSILERSHIATVSYRMKRKDGRYAWFESTSRTMRDVQTGQVEVIIAATRDITERHRAEERAHQLQNELAHVARLSTMGEMATGLAHELNQPLYAVCNYIQGCILRLRSGQGQPDEMIDTLKQATAEATRAGQIIQRLRNFVRKWSPVRVVVDINEVVREVVGLVEPEARQNEVTLQFELGESLPPALIDRIQIEQVIVNLVRNAVEAITGSSGARRLVIVRTCRADDPQRIAVSVSDTGGGIDATTAERLFEPFFTTKTNGMGMGLPISMSIIEAHGGRLELASGGPGGCTFRFTLPVGDDGGAGS